MRVIVAAIAVALMVTPASLSGQIIPYDSILVNQGWGNPMPFDAATDARIDSILGEVTWDTNS